MHIWCFALFFRISKFNMQGLSKVFQHFLHNNTKVLPHTQKLSESNATGHNKDRLDLHYCLAKGLY